MTRTRLGPGAEFDLIRRFLAGPAAGTPAGVRVAAGDDAAVLEGGIVLSCDLAVEGVHFRRDWLEPEEIGYRTAVAAFSDLAAMAARPVALLLALGAPERDVPDVAEALVRGAASAADELGAALIGGDVTLSPERVVLDAIVVGRTESALLRSGARAGDDLWVTGELGGAAAAVRAWSGGREPADAARRSFARPTARTAEALWLVEQADVTAGIDLSDGLAGDAGHVAAASGVRVELDASAIPVHEAAGASVEDALHGGEDYELCLAAPPRALDGLVAAFGERFGIGLSRVGRALEGEPGIWLARGGAPERLDRGGWSHFRSAMARAEEGAGGGAMEGAGK